MEYTRHSAIRLIFVWCTHIYSLHTHPVNIKKDIAVQSARFVHQNLQFSQIKTRCTQCAFWDQYSIYMFVLFFVKSCFSDGKFPLIYTPRVNQVNTLVIIDINHFDIISLFRLNVVCVWIWIWISLGYYCCLIAWSLKYYWTLDVGNNDKEGWNLRE